MLRLGHRVQRTTERDKRERRKPRVVRRLLDRFGRFLDLVDGMHEVLCQASGDYTNDTSSRLTWRRRNLVWSMVMLPFFVAAASKENTTATVICAGVTLMALGA